MTKKLLGGLALAALIASPAMAADLPAAPVYKAARPVEVVYNWSGFYVGGNVGGLWSRTNATTTTVFDPAGYFATSSVPAIGAVGAQKITSTGITGGVQAGYNWQMGATVFGIEADFGYLGTKGSTSGTTTYPCCAPTGFTVTSSANSTWLFTARPRLGIAINNWLLYGTGGVAVGQAKTSFAFSDTFATAAESGTLSATKVGWAAGAGAEVGFGAWSFKLEYLHVNLGTATVTSTNLTAFAPPISFPGNVFTHSANLNADIVRVGLNYRFGGPVVARY